MKKISFTLLVLLAIFSVSAQHTSTLDDLHLAPDSYYNGSDLSGGFLDGDAYFVNNYDTAYFSWSGFAYSNVKVNVDTIHSGSNDYSYQYTNAADSGVNGSQAFGISYTGNDDATIRLKGFAPGKPVYGMYVTNTGYDYLSMKYGDGFAKKFGGVTGTDPDWFLLTINGWYQGALVSNAVQVYLADFRSPDTAQHYILRSWQYVNLLSLGNVDSIFFTLTSSDTGQFGMNTPAYFAFDNFTTTDGLIISGGPVAVNDSFTVAYMDTLTGNADTLTANILANDTFNASLGYTVSIVSYPLIPGAVAYLDSNNNLIYVPAAGIRGVDTVTYKLCDQFDSCSTAEVLITIIGPLNTGITDIENAAIHLYPNPTSSRISVSSSTAIQSITIIDVSGRQVAETDVNRTATTLDVSALSAGVYSLLIHTADGIAARRLVKE